ncbi:hypothetical protein [Streptomyces toxytricini]|uniref:hypothetical protein n=1 Tax=Streptomyces toxytricini TaxID=67369 RepID=UPI00343B14B3
MRVDEVEAGLCGQVDQAHASAGEVDQSQTRDAAQAVVFVVEGKKAAGDTACRVGVNFQVAGPVADGVQVAAEVAIAVRPGCSRACGCSRLFIRHSKRRAWKASCPRSAGSGAGRLQAIGSEPVSGRYRRRPTSFLIRLSVVCGTGLLLRLPPGGSPAWADLHISGGGDSGLDHAAIGEPRADALAARRFIDQDPPLSAMWRSAPIGIEVMLDRAD